MPILAVSPDIRYLIKHVPADLRNESVANKMDKLKTVQHVIEVYRKSLDQEIGHKHRAILRRRLELAGRTALDIKERFDIEKLPMHKEAAEECIQIVMDELHFTSVQYLQATD